MNTLVYADIDRGTDQQRQLHRQHHAADVDQLRRGDCVAHHRAFCAAKGTSGAAEMIHGIHKGLIALGCLTIVSTLVFSGLKRGDGASVSGSKHQFAG